MRKDINALAIEPSDAIVKMGAAVQLKLFARNRRGGTDLIPGTMARLRRQFPGTDLVVFGHSHIPLQAVDGDFRIFNPGSPTDKRRQPHRTLGVLEIEDGRLTRAEIVTLP